MRTQLIGMAAGLAAVAGLVVVVGAGCSAGGSAGMDARMPGPGCPANPDDLISDFKVDNGLHIADGRQGGWYVYGDDPPPTGTFDPPKVENQAYPVDLTQGNDACSGKGSMRVKGTGWTDWGAALGTDFKPRGAGSDGGMGPKGVYDASKYRGVAFWAKGATAIRFVQVKFLDPWTDRDSPLPMADWCIYTPGSSYNCSPYLVKFGYGYGGAAANDGAVEPDAGVTPEFADFPAYKDYKVDTTWKRFEVFFADTKQDRDNGGQMSPGNKLDTTQLMGMAIQVNADYSVTPKAANDFEIWVDDVEFIK